MIRLGSLAGYPFEGPRLLGGWTPPQAAAVYAVMYKPEPAAKPENYAVIYVGHAEDLAALLVAAREVAEAEGIAGPERGYRLIFNVGPDSLNSVPHLHLHVLGGRQLKGLG